MQTDVARLVFVALAALAVILPAVAAVEEEDSYFCAVYSGLYQLLTPEEQKEIDQTFKHKCDDEGVGQIMKRKPNFIRFGRSGIQEKRKPNFIRFG